MDGWNHGIGCAIWIWISKKWRQSTNDDYIHLSYAFLYLPKEQHDTNKGPMLWPKQSISRAHGSSANFVWSHYCKEKSFWRRNFIFILFYWVYVSIFQILSILSGATYLVIVYHSQSSSILVINIFGSHFLLAIGNHPHVCLSSPSLVAILYVHRLIMVYSMYTLGPTIGPQQWNIFHLDKSSCLVCTVYYIQ